MSGSVTLTAGLYNYSSVHIYPGGSLEIDSTSGGAVTLTVSTDFTVDAGGFVGGVGLGYSAGGGPGAGTSGGGAGHGGTGGSGTLNSGGSSYDVVSDPALPGSGGGTATTAGGAGGAALIVVCGGAAILNGSLDFSGTQGSQAIAAFGGGGGSGGTLNIQASGVSGSGDLAARGGGGSPGSSGGGGGGSGGMINLCTAGAWTFTGGIDYTGGGAGPGGGASGGGVGQYYYCSFSGGPSPTATVTQTFTYSFTPSPSYTASPSPSPALTATPSWTLTPTPTYTPYSVLDLSGTLALGAGTYGYSSVHLHAGAVLNVSGAVTLLVSGGDFILDNGATINGNYGGYGSTGGPGAPFGGSNLYSGVGASHAGVGGATWRAPSSSDKRYDSATDPLQPGSGGDQGYQCGVVPGGAGGSALVVQVSGYGSQAVLNGLVTMNGSAGTSITVCEGTYDVGGGGGSGGTINIQAYSISGNGNLLANGGNGGDATPYGANTLCREGGGGGGGGLINLCMSGSYTFAGSMLASRGSNGACNSSSAGGNGTAFVCAGVGPPTATYTCSPSFTASPTFTASPSFTGSPTISPTFSASPTATVTQSATSTLTPSPTTTACGPLSLNGPLTLASGSYCFSSVHLYSGATLSVNGMVTLYVSSGDFTMDPGAVVDGTGGGNGPASGPGAPYGIFLGSGAGHAGFGGQSAYPGGQPYDNPAAPGQPGSGGAPGDNDHQTCGQAAPAGGSGGAALVIQVANGNAVLDGQIKMDGTNGGDNLCADYYNNTVAGGGGSGGTVNVSATQIMGDGPVSAGGGSGGNGYSGYAGGGGSGGLVNLCGSGAYQFAGQMNLAGGNGGFGVRPRNPNYSGATGQFYACGSSTAPTLGPTFTLTVVQSPTASPTCTATPTSTATPTATPSATSTVSPTPTPTGTRSPVPSATATPGFAASGMGRPVLAPVPCTAGQPLCLYFDAAPAASLWQVYALDQTKVADLSFGAGYSQCWQTKGVAPGLYLLRVTVVYQDGNRRQMVLKAVVVR